MAEAPSPMMSCWMRSRFCGSSSSSRETRLRISDCEKTFMMLILYRAKL